VRRCAIAKFSHGGGLFAAVGRSNVIQVYNAFDPAASAAGGGAYAAAAAVAAPCGGSGSASGAAGGWAPAAQLRGHVSSVTDMAWSGDDRRLVSCGAGGAVYVWDPATGARLAGCEFIDKARIYTAGGSRERKLTCWQGRLGARGWQVAWLLCKERGLLPAVSRRPTLLAAQPAVCYAGRCGGALARTADGRLQHIVDGRLVREVSGLSAASASAGGAVQGGAAPAGAARADFAPLLAAARGRALLAATGGGAVVTLGWPEAREGGTIKPGAGSGHGGTGHSSGGHAAQGGRAGGAEASGGGWAAGDSAAAGQEDDEEDEAAPQPRETRLHAGRVAAMALLPGLGVLFTAASDGAVLMSRVSLVLGGTLSEAPAIWSPAALAAAAAGGGGAAAGGPPGPAPAEVRLAREASVGALVARLREAAAALKAQERDAQYQVGWVGVGLGVWLGVGGYSQRSCTFLRACLALTWPSCDCLPSVAQALLASKAARERQAGAEAELAAVRAELADTAARLQRHLDSAAERERKVGGAPAGPLSKCSSCLAGSEPARFAFTLSSIANRLPQTCPTQMVEDLGRAHSEAAEELEGLYEARLALEAGRYAQLQAAKAAVERAAQERLRRQAEAHAAAAAGAAASADSRLASEAARAAAAEAARAEADAIWSEAMAQAEADLEDQAERDGEKLLLTLRSAEEVRGWGGGSCAEGATDRSTGDTAAGRQARSSQQGLPQIFRWLAPTPSQAQMQLRAEANLLRRANARMTGDRDADMAARDALLAEVTRAAGLGRGSGQPCPVLLPEAPMWPPPYNLCAAARCKPARTLWPEPTPPQTHCAQRWAWLVVAWTRAPAPASRLA
jgi:hypothetical protein